MDTFEKDGVARNAQGIAVGRIVLEEKAKYKKGKPLKVAMLTVGKDQSISLLGSTYFVDGVGYRVPKNFPEVKITEFRNRWVLDSFILKPVGPFPPEEEKADEKDKPAPEEG